MQARQDTDMADERAKLLERTRIAEDRERISLQVHA